MISGGDQRLYCSSIDSIAVVLEVIVLVLIPENM
jgi:hypothetical protein